MRPAVSLKVARGFLIRAACHFLCFGSLFPYILSTT
jgi:hypothetical protein